ncbi:hypothetical protein BsWGS_10380 [Bradybaena similaris]
MASAQKTASEAEFITARRTESLDAPHILKLQQPWTEKLFGRTNIVNIIEQAVLAITLCNKVEDIMGHAAFVDFPNIPGVDQAIWETWYNNRYVSGHVNSLNSLFLHYFVAKKEYALGCAVEIIRTAFNAVPDLHFVFLAVPNGHELDLSLAQVFKLMDKNEAKFDDEYILYVCRRHEHVPVLHIRQAFVEDHDDLTPIFNRQSTMLQDTYGDYFLAELIEAQDADMQCLVAEVEKTSYGFMSISTDVNLDLLNECFELIPFHGLRKPHPDDDYIPPSTPPPTLPVSVTGSEHNRDKATAEVSRKISEHEEAVKVPSQMEATLQESSRKASAKESLKEAASPSIRRGQRLADGGSMLTDLGKNDEVVEIEHAESPKLESAPCNIIPKGLALPTYSRFVPTYYGAPNAFSIQLFCIAEQYEMRSCDFLPQAFSLFPDRDYCIITLPYMVPEFPLIQNFVRVTPKCPSILPQELYVFHRSGLLKNFKVRTACSSDYENVEKLVETINYKENLLTDLQQFNRARRDPDGVEIQAFVAECQTQVVGIAILRTEEDIEYIRSHYNIEEFIYYNHHHREDHGHLHHLVLNPVFNHLTKHFIKEVLRLAHKTCLYYPLYPPYTSREILGNHSLITGLNVLVPVRDRRQIDYSVKELGINAPSDRILKTCFPYALNHINKKLVLEPKVTINARIVVVGASDVGIAFLETFVYCPHLRFNNLTLISPHGIPGDLPPSELREMFLGQSYCYNHSDYAKMALRTWVNVVYGKMTSINRTKKHVIVNGSAIVPYDHLILATGLQYYVPAPTKADVYNGANNDSLPQSPDLRYNGPVPPNLFLVNDSYDAAVLLYRAEQQFMKTKQKIVVYGGTIDTFTCLQALLKLGIPGSDLILVEPPIANGISCFNNPVVDNEMKSTLRNLGIKVHTDCYLANWNDGEVANYSPIRTVAFTNQKGHIRLECQALICFFKRGVDIDAFKAINCACLVFDGRLVINTSFHTNDITVHAAGTLTKFRRSYYCDPWTHANYSSKEVGIALASEMLHLFDPTLELQTEPPEEPLNLVPIYRCPKVISAFLPGDYHYLHVYKPCLPTPLAQEMASPNYGRVLITGQPGTDTDYFRLHINQYSSIETITCLSKKPFSNDNLLCLYGIHEKTLNKLCARFDEKLISDLYGYLNEPWAMAVYHDRFSDFRDEIRDLLISDSQTKGSTLEDLARRMVDEETELTDSQKRELMVAYISTGAKRAVETRLLNFICYNYYHLPMYAKPGMV